MRLDRYELAASRKLTTFEFVSVGPKGRIPKLIQYDATNLAHVSTYLLEIRMLKQERLTTAQFQIMAIANKSWPPLLQLFTRTPINILTDGYTPQAVQKRGPGFYRMGITKYYEDAINDFDIFGRINEDWEEFMLGVNYDAFVVRRKSK